MPSRSGKRILAAEARLYDALRKVNGNDLEEQERGLLDSLGSIEGVKAAADALGKKAGKEMNQDAEIAAAVAALEQADIFALDLETIGTTKEKDSALDPKTNLIEGVSVAVGLHKNQGWWFPFRSKRPGVKLYSQIQVFRALDPILKNPNKTLVGSNPKFDLQCLKVQGVLVENRLIDTVVSDWLMDENQRSHGLKEIVEREFGIKAVKWAEAKAMEEDPSTADAFAEYALNDSRYVFRVWRDVHEPNLGKDPRLLKLFHEVEMEIIQTFVESELDGVCIDRPYLLGLRETLNKEAAEAAEKACAALGRKIDISSSQEVSVTLFGSPTQEALETANVNDRVKARFTDKGLFDSPPGMIPLPLDKKGKPILPGKNGYYSTDDGILSRIKGNLFIDALLDHRWATKLLSTYVEPYLEQSEATGRIYPDFHQAGTVAGRFTCSKPALQTIPTEKGKYSIKKMFIPAPGYAFVCGDFNQLQFRLVGHFAKRVLGKSVVADSYLAGMDLHTKTQKELKLADRKPAKTINFGFIFGRSADSFAYGNHLPIAAAKTFYNGFHGSYPEIKAMQRACMRSLCEKGYVASLTGRRRRFPEHKGKDPDKLQKGDSLWWDSWIAWNAMIQGAEADVVRISMRNIYREIKERRKTDPRWNNVRMKVQVHDELVYETPQEIEDDVMKMVKEKAESCLKLEIPLIFDVGISRNNWEEAKK